MKRLYLHLTMGILLFATTPAWAVFVGGGFVTRFTSGTGVFGIYLAEPTAGGCQEGWYYSHRADFANADDYKQLLAVALAAYSQNKRVHVFNATADCSNRRFNGLDTQD